MKSVWPWQEAGTGLERKTCVMLTYPREGATACHRGGPQGKAPVLVREQKRVRDSLGQSLCWGFFRKDKAGQGKQIESFWQALGSRGSP